MKKDSGNAGSGGISFCGALALIFIVLKLTNVITWPWVWVLSPIWIPMIIGVIVLIIWIILLR